jgi:hypothetical protein
MFIERNLELAMPQGLVAMITMQSWMFLSSYGKLRGKMLNRQTILSMAHLGARAFDTIGGEIVSTTAFVIVRAKHPDYKGSYIRLIDANSEARKEACLRDNIPAEDNPQPADFYHSSAVDFKKIPGAPIAYWVSNSFRDIFVYSKPISEVATARQGLVTAANEVFVRLWFEVSSNRIGFAYKDRLSAQAARHGPLRRPGDHPHQPAGRL